MKAFLTEPSLQKPSHKKLPEQRGIMVWANSSVRREHSACGSCFLIPGTNLASPSPYHSDNKLHFNLNLVHYSYYNTWAFSPYLFSTSPLDPLYQVYCFILSELLGLPGKAFMLSMKMSNTLSLTLFCFNEQSRKPKLQIYLKKRKKDDVRKYLIWMELFPEYSAFSQPRACEVCGKACQAEDGERENFYHQPTQ